MIMEQDISLPQIEHKLQRLTEAYLTFKTREEENEIIQGITTIDQPLSEKYKQLPVSQLIKKNVKDSSTAKTVNACLREVENLGKNLMRRKEQMPAAWSEVKSGKRQFNVITKVVGGISLLLKLGYTEQTSTGYRFPGFPDSVEEDKPGIARFTAAVVCLQAELRAYIEGQQPSTRRVNDCILQDGDADNIYEEEFALVQLPPALVNLPQQTTGEQSNLKFPHLQTAVGTGSITVTAQEENEKKKSTVSPKSCDNERIDTLKQNEAKEREFSKQLSDILEKQQGQPSRKGAIPENDDTPAHKGETTVGQKLPHPVDAGPSKNEDANGEMRRPIREHPNPDLLKDLRDFKFPDLMHPPAKRDKDLPSTCNKSCNQPKSEECQTAQSIDMGGLHPGASDLVTPHEFVGAPNNNRLCSQRTKSRTESGEDTVKIPKAETNGANKSRLGLTEKQGDHSKIARLEKTIQFIETRMDRLIINDPVFIDNPEYIALQERLDKSKQELSDLQKSKDSINVPTEPKPGESDEDRNEGFAPQEQDNKIPPIMPSEDLQKIPEVSVSRAATKPANIPRMLTGSAKGMEIQYGVYSKQLPVGQDDKLHRSLSQPKLPHTNEAAAMKKVVQKVQCQDINPKMHEGSPTDVPAVQGGRTVTLGEAPTESDTDTWKCAQCGLLNQVASLDCVACNSPRLKPDSQPAKGLTETYIEPQHHYYEIDEAKLSHPLKTPHISPEINKDKSPLRQASVPGRPALHKAPLKPPPKSRPGSIKKSLTSILELQKRPLPAAPLLNEPSGVLLDKNINVPPITPLVRGRAPERFIKLNHPSKYTQKITRRPPPPQKWTCQVCDVANKPSEVSCKKCKTNKNSKLSLMDQKIQFIMKQGHFRQEAVEDALKRYDSDVYRSIGQLTRQIVQMFEETIWETAHQDIPKGKVDNDVAKILQDQTLNAERRVRMIMVEGDLEDATRAENAVSLIDDAEVFIEGLHVQDVIEAVKIGDGDRDSSKGRLVQECRICLELRPLNQIQGLIFCPCPVCTECFIRGYASYVKNKPPFEWRCLVCGEPNREDEDAMKEHFGFLDIKIQQILKVTSDGASIYELFSKRLAHWKLKDEENFIWCKTPKCENGFIHGDANKINCPFCQKSMCWKCDETWTEAHNKRTCAEYQEWKNQQEIKGVRDELKKRGEYIECPNPKCKELFEVTRGGCIHFKCSQCHHEFCNGCRVAFVRDKKRGLSCNHPRNCLAYIRDFQVKDLQLLLKKHKVEIENLRKEAPNKGNCIVREVKNQGEPETHCGEKILSKGFCEKHYKEWLATLVKLHRLDPVAIMDKNELNALLEKEKIKYDKKGKMADEEYTEYLREVVADKLPLHH